MSEFAFVDTTFGGVNHRNNPRHVSEVLKELPESRRDCYATWHRFTDAYSKHVEKTGSVTGYKGPSWAQYLPIDIDAEDDLEAALGLARDFLHRLEHEYEATLDDLRCWFSGHKGFHIALPEALFSGFAPGERLAKDLKKLALILADGFEVDPSIYDRNRLFRIEGTINTKSGKWKIPLTAQEVLTLSVGQILTMAEEPRELELPPWADAMPVKNLVDLWEKVQESPDEEVIPPSDPIQTGKADPSRVSNATKDLLFRGAPAGERDNGLYAAGCDLKGCGYDFETAEEMLRVAASRCRPPYSEEETTRAIKSAWNDERTPSRPQNKTTENDVKNNAAPHRGGTASSFTLS